MTRLRLGCVKYLNAKPLILGWPGDVAFDHPSALCRRLAQGEFDAALVSSFEFLRNPIYQIVDGVAISSDGPVYSVVVAFAGEFSRLEEIELDPAAETSVNLLKCLLAELRVSSRFVASSTHSVTNRRGLLLIGDQAIQFRQRHGDEFQFWDLGEQWRKLFGLPFVYALWLIRPEVPGAKEIADRLRAVRDDNLHHLDHLIAKQDDPAFCTRYYRHYLRFSFGTRDQEGLRMFDTLCQKHGLVQKRPLRLDLV